MIISAGLDQMYDEGFQARQGVMACLSILNTVNQDNPNLMIMQFFSRKSDRNF
jgi:hypothetical protein